MCGLRQLHLSVSKKITFTDHNLIAVDRTEAVRYIVLLCLILRIRANPFAGAIYKARRIWILNSIEMDVSRIAQSM